MKQTTFSFALVLSVIVLMAYAFVAFLGMVYWAEGALLVPIISTLGFLAVAILMVLWLCRAKASRWRRIRRMGQAVAGTFFAIVVLLSMLPFGNFLNVLSHQEELTDDFEQTIASAEELDAAYGQYVDRRVERYRQRLATVASPGGQRSNPTEYETLVGGAAGSTDAEKIDNLCASLRRHLLPASDSTSTAFHAWLDGMKGISVWNVGLPANIKTLYDEVNSRTESYSSLSARERAFKGEPYEPFAYASFGQHSDRLTAIYRELPLPPSFLAVLLALLTAAVALLPYWVTQKPISIVVNSSDKQKDSESPYE